jgi:hypothetical protein
MVIVYIVIGWFIVSLVIGVFIGKMIDVKESV